VLFGVAPRKDEYSTDKILDLVTNSVKTWGINMDSIPWHPVLVHLPIALSVLLPILTLILWFLLRGISGAGRIWLLIPVLATLNVVAMYGAQYSGQIEFDRIAPLISDDAYLALEAHAQLGNKMLTLSLLVWGFSTAMIYLMAHFSWMPLLFMVLSFFCSVPVLYLAQSGTQLIYVHGLSEVGR
jgi:uncharacterized membrane protein